MPSSILLLSGPVGAGKMTIASALIELLPGAVARIGGDVFWVFFAKGGAKRSTPETFRLMHPFPAPAAAA
jgi:chloramphenicol 3-O-phosphotransferase